MDAGTNPLRSCGSEMKKLMNCGRKNRKRVLRMTGEEDQRDSERYWQE